MLNGIGTTTAPRIARNIANWSPNSLPPDRSIFKDLYTTWNGDKLGEGSLVKLVAYVMKVKKGGKESVNCGQSSAAFIDFHVVLVPTKTSTLSPLRPISATARAGMLES